MLDLDQDVTLAPVSEVPVSEAPVSEVPVSEAPDEQSRRWYRGFRLNVAVLLAGVVLIAAGVVSMVLTRAANTDADAFAADQNAAAARLVDVQGEIELERAGLVDAQAELAGIEERLSAVEAETAELLATQTSIEQESADVASSLALIADDAKALRASIDAMLATTDAAVAVDVVIAGYFADAVDAGSRRDLGTMATHLENGRSALDGMRSALDEQEAALNSLETKLLEVGASMTGGHDDS